MPGLRGKTHAQCCKVQHRHLSGSIVLKMDAQSPGRCLQFHQAKQLCVAGALDTQGSDGAFFDAPERQEQALAPRERRAASEAPPVVHVTPPAPPSTPIASPALSAAQMVPETPPMPRCSVACPL